MRRIIASRKRQGRFTSAPVVSGSTTVGSVISTTNGVFTGPTSTYTYQWFLDGSPISGATSSTYTLPALSNGVLRCVVKVTNARGSVKATSNYFIIRNSFDFVVKTDNTSSGSSTATQFKLPLVSTGTYNCTVYWGDGTSDTITTWNQAQTTHTYATAGTYNVSIVGTLTGWRFANTGDRLKFLTVKWWGNGFRPGNNDSIFRSCTNLTLDNVRDVLDTTGMTTFLYLFQNCPSLVKVKHINEWNTSNITFMGQVFDSCINFNDNIGNWNMSNVTSFDRMFAHAGNFDNGGSPDINNWDTSNVTFMRYMFGTDGNVPGCTSMKFNQPIGNWNTSKVTNTSSMFGRNTKFNQDINTKSVTKNGVTYTAWDTKEITNMSYMFYCSINPGGAFNQSIGNWNTSKATTLYAFFANLTNFNQDVSTKTVTINGVTYTAWDTSLVTNMGYMFYLNPGLYGSFNHNISTWNTSNVTSMVASFERQVLFNQPLNSWNTSKVTNMGDMFNGASSFNQPIGNFNVSLVTSFVGDVTDGFMGGKTYNDYSAANYDALLIGWASRPVLANKTINFGTIKYTSAAVDARAILTSAPNNWTIIDGGKI